MGKEHARNVESRIVHMRNKILRPGSEGREGSRKLARYEDLGSACCGRCFCFC